MNVVWKPLPGSQSLGLTAPVNHLLLHGTRGGGKTDVQPMRFRRHVGQGYGQFWRGIIFDREYKSLDDIIAKTKRHFPRFGDGCKFLSGQGQYAWKWSTGEELLFRVMKNPDDYLKYHGQEFPFIGFNELTKYPTADCYELIQSCNRSGFIPDKHSPDLKNPLPDIPLEVVSTTNPSGPGHNWVKRRFIDPVPDGKVLKRHSTVFNPRTQREETITKTQVSIFSSYKENIYLPPEYVADLQNISDPNKRRAWLEGDWNVSAGGAIDDLWDNKVHVLDRFEIPNSWRVTRSFDWGSSHPFSTGWWGVSNGEEVMVNGKKRVFPKGSLVRCAELYGAENRSGDRFGHNTGVKWSARKIAKRQKDIEEELQLLGWIAKKPQPGPADSQIYAVNEAESGCIGDIMAKEGIKWTPADKRAGTRKNGLQLLRDMLENAVTGEGPGLYVMRNCQAFINTVPMLPRDSKDPDDVNTEAIDHCFVAGTMVQTVRGERPIETLAVGDLVWTREGLKPIIETHATPNQPIFDVEFGAGKLTGTGNHPVWVEGDWKRIDLLTKGERLTGWNHQTANSGLCIKDVKRAGKAEVFNITVAGCHEYFANGVLVHNCYDDARYMVLEARPNVATKVNVGFVS